MNLTVIEGKRNLIIQAPRVEEDIPKWESISQMNMDEFMRIHINEDSISYSCPKFISLAKRLENPINEFDFHMIIAQIARVYKVAHHIGLSSDNVVWNPELVFMSPTTREIKFILLMHKEEGNTTFQSLLEEVIYSVKQSNMDDSYVSEFVYHLKRFDAFDYNDILSYITEFDSKVTRLLQLKKPISYEMPKIVLPVSEFQTMDTMKEELEKPKETTEIIEEETETIALVKEELSEDSIPEEKIQDVQSGIVELEEPVQEETEKVSEQEILLDEVSQEENEDVEQEVTIEEPDTEIAEQEEQTEEKKPTKLSFADMFTEGSEELIRDEDNDYYDDYEVSSKLTFEDMDTLLEKESDSKFNVEIYLIRESTEETIPIDKEEFFLGKSSYIDGYSVKGNPAVSRKHALIVKEDGKYNIQDLGSVNGTFVNQEQVESQKKIEIHAGDLIELGNERFIVKGKSND